LFAENESDHTALARLWRAIADDKFALSARVKTWRAILDKIVAAAGAQAAAEGVRAAAARNETFSRSSALLPIIKRNE
jgi:hypothetical protein